MKIFNSSHIYLVFTILSWSSAPSLTKIALNELNNLQLLFYTSIVAVLSLLLVVCAQNKLHEIKKFTKQDYSIMFGMGTLGIFLYYVFLFRSFSIAPAGQANVINYLWPIFITLFSIPILKEKFNTKTIIAIILSFIGALVIFTEGELSNFSNQFTGGYLLAAIGAVCYGLFSVLGKKLHYEKFSSMLIYSISAVLLIIPTTIIFSDIVVPQSLSTIIAILILGGICNSITFVFWFKALKNGNTHKIANIIYIVPFLSLIWTFFLNNEPIQLFSVVGLILIVSGIIVQLKNKI